MAETKIDLKLFSAPVQVTDTQIGELLYSKVAGCPDIKSVTPNPKIGIALLSGKYNNYTVEHKHGKIHVKPKINYAMSVLLSAFSIPFALWLTYTFDFDKPFSDYALPLALLFLSFGIAWLVGYTLGDKEQKTILSYIYNTLTKNPTDEPVKNAKSVSANKMVALLPILIGVALLVLKIFVL
ncbi:MAG: hypothetical protein FWD44_04330 [Oscillospiraceae bacterium]|nr:hypothetical protein [Oscillospiraceae bacterium]